MTEYGRRTRLVLLVVCRKSVEQRSEALRCYSAETVLDDRIDLGPVGVDIEPDSDPATVTNIGWNEEPRGFRGGQLVLDTGWCRAPDRRARLVVRAVGEHGEHRLAADEEGRRTVAEPFAALR